MRCAILLVLLLVSLPSPVCAVRLSVNHAQDLIENVDVHAIDVQRQDFKEQGATIEWPCFNSGLPSLAEIAAQVRSEFEPVVKDLRSSFGQLLEGLIGVDRFFAQTREKQQDLAKASAERIKAMFVKAASNMVDSELRSGPNTVLIGLSASASQAFSKVVPHFKETFRNASGVGLTFWFDPKTLSMIGEAEGSWNFAEAAPTKHSSPWSVEGMIAAKLIQDSSVQQLSTRIACGPALIFGYSVPTAHGALGLAVSLGLNDHYQIDDVSVGLTLGSDDGLAASLGYSAAKGLLVRQLPGGYDQIISEMLKDDPPLRLIRHASDSDSFEADQRRVQQLSNWDLFTGFFTGNTTHM